MSTDEQAFGVLFAAWSLGLSIPGDLAIVGFDGISDSAYSVPPLATVRQQLSEIAERALELLTSDAAAQP